MPGGIFNCRFISPLCATICLFSYPAAIGVVVISLFPFGGETLFQNITLACPCVSARSDVDGGKYTYPVIEPHPHPIPNYFISLVRFLFDKSVFFVVLTAIFFSLPNSWIASSKMHGTYNAYCQNLSRKLKQNAFHLPFSSPISWTQNKYVFLLDFL